jgi:THO complex subunit 1
MGMKNTIATYLQDGPDGKFYYRMVDTVLSRDKNWVRWKMEACPPISRDPVSARELNEGKVGAQKATASKRLKNTPLGSLTLDFLSNGDHASGFDALKNAER